MSFHDTLDTGLTALVSDDRATGALAVAGAATLAAAVLGTVAVVRVGMRFIPFTLVGLEGDWTPQYLDEASLAELSDEEMNELNAEMQAQCAKTARMDRSHPGTPKAIAELREAVEAVASAAKQRNRKGLSLVWSKGSSN